MALVLGIPVKEKVFIGGDGVMVVTEILGDTECIIMMRIGSDSPKSFHLTTDRSFEIYPEVRVSVGRRGKEDVARIVFEAPRRIHLQRESAGRRQG